ncbi:MAG: type II toxin-antitoxin system PemK/MazF family toxin [Deltaproteobacteria bacterium]|nr:type II toxin-antitoxin system PemK/MazF family toxin [Deltaproteobacteria bacterium]MBF0527411.1 type II toxin-antitoxin system PemK/MazF family toxin [Deltaproteobacteria bacterium]
MRRGDIFIAVVPGDYGKPRPVLIVQNDVVNDTHASVVICPISSHLIEAPLFRLYVLPTSENGLSVPSQIMVDKISAIKRERLRDQVGRISDELLIQVNRSLAFWVGLGL